MKERSGYQWSIAYYMDCRTCAICGGDHYWEQCRTVYATDFTSLQQYYDDEHDDSSAEEIDYGYMRAPLAAASEKLQSMTDNEDAMSSQSRISSSRSADTDGEDYSLLSAAEVAFLKELDQDSDDEEGIIFVNPVHHSENFEEEFEYPMFEVGYTEEPEILTEEEVPQPLHRMIFEEIPMQDVAEPEEETLKEEELEEYIQEIKSEQVQRVEDKPRIPSQRKMLDLSIYTCDESPILPVAEEQTPDALLLEQNECLTDLHRSEIMQEGNSLPAEDEGIRHIKYTNHKRRRPRLRKKKNKKHRLKARLVDTLVSSLSPLRITYWNSGKQAKWKFRC